MPSIPLVSSIVTDTDSLKPVSNFNYHTPRPFIDYHAHASAIIPTVFPSFNQISPLSGSCDSLYELSLASALSSVGPDVYQLPSSNITTLAELLCPVSNDITGQVRRRASAPLSSHVNRPGGYRHWSVHNMAAASAQVRLKRKIHHIEGICRG